jgi:hypothetical protein
VGDAMLKKVAALRVIFPESARSGAGHFSATSQVRHGSIEARTQNYSNVA